MNIKEFKEWANAPGREVFTSSSEEIQGFIQYAEKLEDMLFEVGAELAELKVEPSPFWGT